MFDLGFSELLVIALVALVVLGPQRLPKAARFAGLWVRRARAHWYSVKSEFEREIADEELRRTLHDTRARFDSAAADLRADIDDAERAVRAQTESIQRSVRGDGARNDDAAAALPAAAAIAEARGQAAGREDAQDWTPEEVPIPEEALIERPSITTEPPDAFEDDEAEAAGAPLERPAPPAAPRAGTADAPPAAPPSTPSADHDAARR